jgi:hypothetical protein
MSAKEEAEPSKCAKVKVEVKCSDGTCLIVIPLHAQLGYQVVVAVNYYMKLD